MSLILLVDGYNVVAPVAPPGRMPDPHWLQRERDQLLRRLVKHLDDSVRNRTCVVFDSANPPSDRPSEFEVAGIQVRFAVDYPEADDLLEEIIAAHSAPKSLAVVSSDHRVQAAAKRRGSQTFEAQNWLDNLLDGRIGLATPPTGGAGQGSVSGPPGGHGSDKPDAVDNDDVQRWMNDFGF